MHARQAWKSLGSCSRLRKTARSSTPTRTVKFTTGMRSGYENHIVKADAVKEEEEMSPEHKACHEAWADWFIARGGDFDLYSDE